MNAEPFQATATSAGTSTPISGPSEARRHRPRDDRRNRATRPHAPRRRHGRARAARRARRARHPRRTGTWRRHTVDIDVEGTRRALPPGVDQAAYRIVQASLTSALRPHPGRDLRKRCSPSHTTARRTAKDSRAHSSSPSSSQAAFEQRFPGWPSGSAVRRRAWLREHALSACCCSSDRTIAWWRSPSRPPSATKRSR